ncbi:palmitoyltransferase swf1 [Coemansia sp. RSA 1646]|nr:palmitoyltransferase swf1 [Coemansia sp. RSA 1646]KAJ2088615.1 palmitoyltransferase swf1 [Coemansia sp. RSA 986]
MGQCLESQGSSKRKAIGLVTAVGIVVAIVAFSAWVFVLILGRNRMFKGTVVERASSLLNDEMPAMVGRWTERSAALRWATERAEGVWMALFGRRTVVFQALAVALYWMGMAVFAVQVAPQIPNRYVGRWHWVPIVATLAVNIGSYVLACGADPGVVTLENEERAVRVFAYDRLLYFANKPCRTCGTRKPARSKHCAVCGRCVQMMDHHCIWLNNCVGLHNVRWFLLFLASFAVVCAYGAFLFATVVLEIRVARGLDRMTAWNDERGRMEPVSLTTSLLYVLDDSPLLAVVAVLLVVLTPAIAIFCGYQVRISMCGYTSNEEAKWLNVADAVADGVVFEIGPGSGESWYEVVEKHDQPADTRPRKLIHSLDDVVNIYDHGAWANLKMLLFPPSASVGGKPHQH